MPLHRFGPLLVFGLGAAFCVACATPSPGTQLATAASAPPRSQPPAPSTAAEALELLRTAETFEDTHVSFDGHLSRYVAAFRVVLASPDASTTFHALADRATPAGRLYGAAGLYFADPPAFEAALARLTADGGSVRTLHGCTGMEEPVASVVRSPRPNRIEVARGESLASWFVRHPDGGPCDLAGGCTPLLFVDDGRAAPRDPVR